MPIKPVTTAVNTTEVTALALERKLTPSVTAIAHKAEAVIITTEAEYQEADQLRALLKAKQKQVEAELDPIIKPIYEGLERLYALKRKLMAPIDAGVRSCTEAMKRYQLAIQRAKEEEERENQRQAQNIQRLADEAAARAKAATPAQAPVLIKRAAVLTERAEAIAAAPSTMQAPVAASSTTRKIPKWRITNFEDLLMAVLEGKVPQEAIKVNEEMMTTFMRKGQIKDWPGVELYEDTQIVSSRR